MQGYRAARELEFEPGSMCALVGEASSGKSTVLTAIWTLLEAAAPPPTIDDVSHGTSGRIHLEAELEKGETIFLDARPPDTLNLNRAGSPPVLFLPANLRSRTLVAPATGAGAARRRRALPAAVRRRITGQQADGGLQLVAGMERLLASNLRRFVLLIEEPELYLSPHLAAAPLQRAPQARAARQPDPLLDARAGLPQRRPDRGPRARPAHERSRHDALPAGAARGGGGVPRLVGVRQRPRELFLARAVLLVEGRTEKLTFPLVFDALGVEPDKEGILILECGGKGNMPLFARICNACDIPYVIVHDRDAPKGQTPVESERVINRQIQDVAGRRRTVVLVPDFEAVSGVTSRGRGRKPRRAYRHYTGNDEVPQQLRLVAERVLKAARA